MQLELKKYLFDILTSIDSIEEFLGGKSDFNSYLSDKLLRRGIERELEIIGEAAARILKINPEFPIENIRRIVDLRNWVIHGYDKIDDVIVWSVITRDLKSLKKQVSSLLKEE